MSGWLIFLILSVATMAIMASVAGACRKGDAIAPRYLVAAGVFLATVLMMIPVNWSDSVKNFFGGLKAVLLAVLNGAQVFAAGCDFSVISQAMAGCEETLAGVFQAWAVVLFVAAPVLTITFAATLVKNIWASAIFYFVKNKKIFIFSDLNEKSLVLAEDIYGNDPKGVCIVFAGLRDEQETAASAWFLRLRKMNTICFKRDLDVLNLSGISKNQEASFFLMGESEAENIRLAKELIPRYKKPPIMVSFYVFAESLESELTLATLGVDQVDVQVKRIRESRTMVNWMLQNRPHRIFGNAAPQPDGTKHIGAVILGMGSYGMEMVKALSWYCQMPGYTVTIDAFDKDPLAEEKFIAKAPELMSPEINGAQKTGESKYTIRIHGGVDVTTHSFLQQVDQIRDVTYVFVNLGSDSLNLETGIELWRQAARKQENPAVDMLIFDGSMKQVLRSYRCRRRGFDGLEVVGDLETAYSRSVILNEELEEMVRRRYAQYNGNNKFRYSVNDEYGYYSTASSAIHACAKSYCDLLKDPAEMTPQEQDEMMKLEHLRWNAYLRSEGFRFSGSRDPASRQQIAKTHQDLVPWHDLTKEDKDKDKIMIQNDHKK